MMRVSTDDQL